jgi:hypothetical protein
MNEDFIFRLGADVSGFTKSISQVEAELKKVQSELKNKTGAAIVETNKYIAELQTSLVNLRSTGLSQLPKAVNDGAASLNALGQVARDAPFGFIAIQNNLPILFDQLGNLSKQSGGAVNALKAIGASLVGPAGVTFAIGAAISAITVLVQKYGSVGGALDAIINKQSIYSEEILEATKSYEKFNQEKRDSIEINAEEIASTEGTISRVRTLSSIVLDQTASYNERNAALNDLKDISKEYFGNLDIEKTKLADLKTAVDNYIVSIQKAAISKGFEAAVGETSVELAKQISLLNKLKGELDDAKRAPVKFIGKADQVDTRDVDAATERYNKQNKIVQSLRDDISLYNTELDKNIRIQNSLQAPVDASNKKLADQKKQVAQSKKNAKSNNAEQKKAIALRAEQIRVDNLYKIKDRIKEQAALNAIELKGYRERTNERRKGEREAGIILPTQISPIVPSLNNEKLLKSVRSSIAELERLKKAANFQATYDLLNSTFFSPIQDLFGNFLETGKFAFAEFGKAILQSIKQLVAKVIATGIIAILAVLATGGFGAAAGGFAGGLAKVGSIVGGSLGFGGGNKVAAPSFGGISGGPLNMAGAVNLSLRGSDLVGSINRTNATISRVG